MPSLLAWGIYRVEITYADLFWDCQIGVSLIPPALLAKAEGRFLLPARTGIEGEGDVRFSCCRR